MYSTDNNIVFRCRHYERVELCYNHGVSIFLVSFLINVVISTCVHSSVFMEQYVQTI